MLPLDRIDDLDVARTLLVSLDRECETLQRRNQELARRLAELTGGDARQAMMEEVAQLQARLAQLERLAFGKSSEKRPQQEEPAVAIQARPPRQGHGPREQPRLAVREQVHELAEDERQCPKCEGHLEPWAGQFEDSELVTVVHRRYEVVQHRRQKYLCTCPDRAILTAPGPAKLVEGGRYSVEFGVEVALDKYLNHLPLDRQRKMMRREGLVVDTQTLGDQVEAVSAVLWPTYLALQQQLLAEPLLHADETRWPVLKSPAAERWQAWALAGEDAVFFKILPSRSAEAGGQLLAGYRGVLMVDGYAAYETIARAGPGISLSHCWAHVRRKFVEIESFYPEECKQVLDLIRSLYEVERQVPFRPAASAEERVDDLARRFVLRGERSRPIVRDILAWAGRLRLTRESVLRKAVEYMTDRWAGLTRFLDDPRVPLDNNRLERALRPLALGRKNFLGSRSERGVVIASVLYSLIETAKLCEVDPRRYLLAAVHAALETPHRVLLPRDLRG